MTEMLSLVLFSIKLPFPLAEVETAGIACWPFMLQVNNKFSLNEIAFAWKTADNKIAISTIFFMISKVYWVIKTEIRDIRLLKKGPEFGYTGFEAGKQKNLIKSIKSCFVMEMGCSSLKFASY